MKNDEPLKNSAESDDLSVFEQVLENVFSSLTPSEMELISSFSKEEIISQTHLTLGAKIRSHLQLWKPEAEKLLNLIAAHEPGYPDVLEVENGSFYINADGASTILIRALWEKINASSEV